MRSKARDREAFSGKPMVVVRCPQCGVRLAQLWSIDTSSGDDYDGIIHAKRSSAPVRPFRSPPAASTLTCQRCGTVTADDGLVVAIKWAEHTRQREVTLGQTAPAKSTSRDW